MTKNHISMISERVDAGNLRQEDSRWLLTEIDNLEIKLAEMENLYKQTIEARDTWAQKRLREMPVQNRNA
jgi:hypothetical protein